MSGYPDDDPELLAQLQEDGKKYCNDYASVYCLLCEECAMNLAEYHALTTIALPHVRAKWLLGFREAWRALPTTGREAINNHRVAIGGREWERIRKEEGLERGEPR